MHSLNAYRNKRDFGKTGEPSGDDDEKESGDEPIFVVQKHHARNLHYDFRLEWKGVLKSWAVPKGPSDLPADKRLAVMVEDHPLDYANFEGEIPKGEYGAGKVMVWDQGTWKPEGNHTPDEGFKNGSLKFTLHGSKLRGSWALARMGGSAGGENWLLIKHRDEWAASKDDIPLIEREPVSVVTGKTLEEVGEADAEVPGSRRGKCLSRPLKPQLATLVDSIPQGDGWLHEVKYDGYRILARKTKEGVELLSRNDKDWSDRFTKIAAALANLAQDAVIDGEIVALDRNGVSSFQALQGAVKWKDKTELTYYVFDLLWCGGQDLRGASLLDRKTALRGLLSRSGALDKGLIRYSDHLRGNGKTFFKKACETGLEGIISKKADAPYRSRRTREWTKMKCTKRQEFVVGGFTEPSGSRQGFGALLLGVYDDNERFLYTGRVGTGFSDKTLLRIRDLLADRVGEKPAFENPPTGSEAVGVTWTKPDLVADVSFTEWTDDGKLRHPSFHGLREDKSPAVVRRERQQKAKPPTSSAPANTKASPQRSTRAGASGTVQVGGIEITHADRTVFPDAKITKGEVAQYYADIAPHLLVHLADRPLSVLRCPDGRKKSCFYQKHRPDGIHHAVGAVDVGKSDGAEPFITVSTEQGIIALAQFGVLELHPWLSRNDRLNRPDLMIFDLDPADDVPWEEVLGAAHLLRDILADYGLVSFPKVTGGKGLHLVVPLLRRHDFETVKPAAKAIAGLIRDKNPSRFVVTASKSKRKGKIFIDYLRNGRGSTAVAPFSVRARQGAPVAVPVSWDEVVPGLGPDQYTVANVRRRLAALRHDPWEGFQGLRQSLTKSMLMDLGVV